MQDWKREHKVVTRCGCQAEMRIKRKAESSNWYVCRFVDEHNHELLPAKFVSYLPAYRKISDVDRAHIDSLRNCMLADVEVEEFERQWEAMMDECLVREVEWVKDLYTNKIAWATAYIRGCFYDGLRTTSRCESLHAKMGRSLYKSPVLQTQFLELEKSGALNYTREIFLCFRELDVGSLLESLVLQRWSKTAKVELEGPSIMNEEGEANEIYRSRMGAFLQHCKRLARVVCVRENDFKICLDRIVEETNMLEMKNGVGTTAQRTAAGAQDGVGDPVAVWTKETWCAQEPFGYRGIKRCKCSNCGVVAHR
ncbi:hypothetical protein Ahy_B10g102635 [Arachis hypogaea]|uniref:FAR1 domain-containing protein n=1 Tax=Arachis hypogaea TaxID=3818 RepID=A0A444X2B1_ARAHY|nr:hypothetical protein Ahy_B10g102635 [Arachis hypogaea]